MVELVYKDKSDIETSMLSGTSFSPSHPFQSNLIPDKEGRLPLLVLFPLDLWLSVNTLIALRIALTHSSHSFGDVARNNLFLVSVPCISKIFESSSIILVDNIAPKA